MQSLLRDSYNNQLILIGKLDYATVSLFFLFNGEVHAAFVASLL